jgi:hypothetical protein
LGDIILPGSKEIASPLRVEVKRRYALSWPLVVLSVLLMATTWLYAPSLSYGLIWDDPHWFGRVVGRSIGELVRPTPDYHFYRPGGLLYVWLFARHDGLLDPLLLHTAQIGWHALNVALAYALSRALGLAKTTAVVVATLVALHPFSHQAVAWAAPLQVMNVALLGGAWLAYLEARRQRAQWRWAAAVSLFLFLVALFVQESSVTLSLVPILLELFRRGDRRRPLPANNAWLAYVYPALAAGFGLLWLLMPRQAGFTALALEPRVALYMLQGAIYPLLGRPWGYSAPGIMADGALWALSLAVLVLLLLLARRAGHGRVALFGLAWAALGLALPVNGLHYSYVTVSPRLFYHAVPGVALLWACALAPGNGPWPPRKRRHLVGGLLLVGIIVQSTQLLQNFNRVYAHGTAHLNDLVQTVTPEMRELIFINFPDRYAPQRPPYPLGYWGVLLAPVVTDLAAFPAILSGVSVSTRSLAMPWLDEDTRAAGPYQIDMRGEIISPEALYETARGDTVVFRTIYHLDGTFSLARAGAIEVREQPASGCAGTLFDGRLCLETAVVSDEGPELRLHLTWLLLAPASPHEGLFIHLDRPGGEPVAQADGDPWLGLLPLHAWQPGDAVHEWRLIRLPEGMDYDPYLIRVGFYNWVSGERYPAVALDGEVWPGDAAVIGRFQANSSGDR